MFVSQPLWVKIVNKVGKKKGYYLASLSWGLGALSWMLAAPGESDLLIALRGCFLGFGAGGLLLVGQSMLPDTMQYDKETTGQSDPDSWEGNFCKNETDGSNYGQRTKDGSIFATPSPALVECSNSMANDHGRCVSDQ